jgi:hypothetical protein
MSFNPSRRFLLIRAWVWTVLPPVLFLLAYLLGGPGSLTEPSEISDLLRPLLIVSRNGDSFRFVSIEDRGKVTPLWAISYKTTALVSTELRFGNGDFGFWKRSGIWKYSLEAHRFDKEWKSGTDPVSLPPSEIALLRPMVIQELNRYAPSEHRGDRLAQLLDQGSKQTSYVCLQNAVILLTWLSVPMAVISIVAMFLKSGRPPETVILAQ